MGRGSLGWPPVSSLVDGLPHPPSWLRCPVPSAWQPGTSCMLSILSACTGPTVHLWASLPSACGGQILGKAETPLSSGGSLGRGVSRGLCCGLGWTPGGPHHPTRAVV